jgi:aminopeptidase
MTPDYQKYAELLVNYCVSLKPGERLFVQSTTLAAPLVKEVYRAALKAGGHCEFNLRVEDMGQILMEEANEEQLKYIPTLYERAMNEFEAYINIGAPFKLRGPKPDAEKSRIRSQAMQPLVNTYFDRTGDLRLKRSMCLFPTQALADEAGMDLEAYTEFVFKGCKLDQPDPKAAWLQVRANQQKIVDHLNGCTEFRYVNERTDLRFTTKGRRWINSDGQTNMPSGEVYTSPEEDSVAGTVYFDYPAIRNGKEVRGVTLDVKDGEIQSWKAEEGQDILDETFELPGTRRFGEAAIGTNYTIDRFSKHILFDEKIGGTIHLAIGQSYKQCGGKNESSVHWDMIADMTRAGEIYADGKMVYRNGKFLGELAF